MRCFDVSLTSYSDRICSPDETLVRITPSLSKHGITRLARLTELDRIGIPVWNAVTPNSRSIVINQGKGILDIDAKVSAAMEALERAVAGNPQLEKRRASLRQLHGEDAVANPLACLISAKHNDIQIDELIDWTVGYDIISERNVWVPHDALLLDDTKPSRFWLSSDGLASGNTLLEATFHGLLERIERDAETIWQFGSEQEKALACIDVQTLNDAVLDRLVQQIRVAGFQLQLFEMTSDIGVPCFTAYIAPQAPSDGELRYIEMTTGHGAHPVAIRAAIRAVTEAAQSRLTYISGARDDIHPTSFSRPLPVHLRRLLELQPQARFSQIDLTTGAPLGEMLKIVIQRLKVAGIKSVIVVPLNPGEENFSVAKVLVPELENPDGNRKRRLGPRALKRILKSK
ncbi:YcaO-like family protein [Rhizobium sp. CB3171]|uniref:YcaO-like family protein n=1 Tax=Rhizobium sp. CB3171 TaxID=3039157 RepID=UPI0024B23FCD|nr:YcaO-like family protein [Rhizobium sp. CB3171]WFU04151.1 YcaO-like family protein [Rhizobium sp. CB3171]